MDEKFNLAFTYVVASEGAYSNHPQDKGGSTNYGVIQTTYNDFRKKQKLPIQDVRKITIDEVKAIYYQFWIGCGANLLDLRSGIAVFDMAINSGPSAARHYWDLSKHNLTQFMSLRETFYKNIVIKDSTQKVFLNGWLNRLTKLQTLLNSLK